MDKDAEVVCRQLFNTNALRVSDFPPKSIPSEAKFVVLYFNALGIYDLEDTRHFMVDSSDFKKRMCYYHKHT